MNYKTCLCGTLCSMTIGTLYAKINLSYPNISYESTSTAIFKQTKNNTSRRNNRNLEDFKHSNKEKNKLKSAEEKATSNDTLIDCCTYEWAYQQYIDMLDGLKPLDFKRAVFIYENTYLHGVLNYDEFSNYFSDIAKLLKDFINKKGISGYKTAKQYAIFSFMFEPSNINNNITFKYDFNDFMGEKDWTNMFVSKVIKTKTGNCHGLPYYYKILANELKTEANLALAPNHLYIKHIDEKGKWVNIELTNGHISSDAWIISTLGITTEAIKKGIYMDALSEEQSVALCIWDLAMSYQKEFGYDDFVLKCCNAVINYFPTCIPALITKKNCLIYSIKRQTVDANNTGINELLEIKKINNDYKNLVKHIQELGYTEIPESIND